MNKKLALSAMFTVAILSSSIFVNAQEVTKGEESSSKNEKVLEQPSIVGSDGVDIYVEKAFSAYLESKNITTALQFIKVEVKEIPANKDGITTELKITNGNGEPITKAGTITQLVELLLRATKQADNISSLVSLQTGAVNGIKDVSPLKITKAKKAVSTAGIAQAYVIVETKKQVEVINQQISTLKALKNN